MPRSGSTELPGPPGICSAYRPCKSAGLPRGSCLARSRLREGSGTAPTSRLRAGPGCRSIRARRSRPCLPGPLCMHSPSPRAIPLCSLSALTSVSIPVAGAAGLARHRRGPSRRQCCLMWQWTTSRCLVGPGCASEGGDDGGLQGRGQPRTTSNAPTDSQLRSLPIHIRPIFGEYYGDPLSRGTLSRMPAAYVTHALAPEDEMSGNGA